MLSTIRRVRDKHVHTWLGGWLVERARRSLRRRPRGPRHLLFALCDHWEPKNGAVPRAIADARVDAWLRRYPALATCYRDADGRPPRHTFFFPGEQYEPAWLDALADLARRGLGEVELHLHHEGEDEVGLRRALRRHVAELAGHGHLARDVDGRPRYAFIHGDWSLANARRDGRRCGVDGELPILFDTGCYADFTFPSAPDETQHAIVNQIYWPTGDLRRRAAHRSGERARVGVRRDDRILVIEGPLAPALRFGPLRPRIENGALQASDPPSPDRIRTWVAQDIHVAGRPEWIFVKVHAHGAPEAQAACLLGEGGHALHRELTARYNDGARWRLHYVTAREMYNLAVAAMAGETGDPGALRDYALGPPPCASG